MSETFKIGEIEVEENRKRSGTLKVAGRSLSPIEVPITIVRGSSSGSTLCVLAGEHGCEYAGIEACVRLSNNISPKELRGTIIIIPVVNVPSFENRIPYVCPIDNVDISSAWPGKQIVLHSISHIITHTIFHQVICKSNYLISLHGGDLVESLSDPCIMLHKTGNKKVDEASENMAKNFGIEYVVEHKEEKGGLIREATERGIPTIGGTTASLVPYKISGRTPVSRIMNFKELSKKLKRLTANPIKDPSTGSPVEAVMAGRLGARNLGKGIQQIKGLPKI